MRTEILQQGAGSSFPEAGRLVTPCELLTWLAFGTPQKKEDFLGGPVPWKPRLNRDVWAKIYKEIDDLPRYCRALEARAVLACHRFDADATGEVIGKYTPVEFCCSTVPGSKDAMIAVFDPRVLRVRRADASQRIGGVVSYRELAAAARYALEAQPGREARLASATALVLAALSDGKITAYEVPANGIPRPIPATLFMNPGITITVFDEIGPDEFHHGPSYRHLWFNGTNIKASGLKPADEPASDSGTVAAAKTTLNGLERAREWMKQNVRRDAAGGLVKHADALADCVKATVCSWENARSAWKTHAPEKRRRGQH